MRLLAAAAVLLLLGAAPLQAGTAKECTNLAARIDNDVSSPSGVRVSISAYNRCSDNVDGSEVGFTVKALAAGGAVVGSQRGSFGGSIAPGTTAQTKVFVVCEPDGVRSVTVEAQ
jgi:hypothetical protein